MLFFCFLDIDECTKGTYRCEGNTRVTIPTDLTTARVRMDTMETAQTALVSILISYQENVDMEAKTLVARTCK